MDLGKRLSKIRKSLRDRALEEYKKDALYLETDILNVTELAEKMN